MPRNLLDEMPSARQPRNLLAELPPASEPSTGDIFREQLQKPLQQFGQPFPPVVTQAVREVVTEDIPNAAADALNASGTHYRTLAHGVGLPVDPPTEQEAANYRNAVIDMLMTTGGARVGQMLGRAGGDILKVAGRGMQSKDAAQRAIDAVRATDRIMGTSHYVPPGAAARTTPWKQWGAPVVSGYAAGKVVDAMDFGMNEYVDAPIAGGAGALVAARTGRDALTSLLLANPKWRDLMMRPTSGRAAALIGAVLGHYGAQALTPETVDRAVDEVARQLQKPAEESHGFYRPGRPVTQQGAY